MTLRKLFIAALGVAVLGGAATAASADTPWERHHSRRDQVNDRLVNLRHSIRRERRDGDLSRGEAFRLDRRLHVIRFQDHRFARHHGGHISRAEQARLNHEENGVRRHIPG